MRAHIEVRLTASDKATLSCIMVYCIFSNELDLQVSHVPPHAPGLVGIWAFTAATSAHRTLWNPTAQKADDYAESHQLKDRQGP